ncbi:Gfo/Idh/MocA family protein [Agromyces kandeliae]|uniref:Gfo/Idh/MocA family oxidoreductase n=1 Tax=Agromyces kandeliae TaxID=2666141 RepID=A0A6L5R6N0_9MICO|nr:Gfo/Idh/MocA family oxidoreductase [Agromyces kandeliae]MRX45184.1 gfo/Idh/MocA family oxidoreductase [Agromyces kandeliae]
MTIRVGLVGYGVGGRLFHSPYIRASRECRLVGIVARSPERVAKARRDHPDVRVFASLGDLMDAGVDAVVVSTPPHTRRELVLESIGRGVHVVADKPFAPTAQDGRELADAAERAGVVLNVFHNRRWDTDIVTARSIIVSGALGRITRLDLRCDQDDPATLEGGPEGGLLRDLGSHVVDQALHLLGPARFVSAQLDWRDLLAGRTDTGFTITIEHESGAHSHVSASKVNRLSSRELRVHGDRGSYRSDFADVQFEALRRGESPIGGRDTWGYESEERWGVLAVESGTRRIPSLQGDYAAFYDAFAEAVQAGGPGPVPAREGIEVLAALDAARASAAEHRTVPVG